MRPSPWNIRRVCRHPGSPVVLAIATVLLTVSAATAQLRPEREFCGVGRSIPVRIEAPRQERSAVEDQPGFVGPVPEPAAAPAEFIIEVVRAATGEIVDRARSAPGGVDLVKLFPRIWEAEDKRAMIAQLRIDGVRIGAPLILTPMFSPPPYAPRVDRAGFPMFPPPDATKAAPAFSGYRVEPMRLLVLETTKGELRFALRPDVAPNTVWYFSQLVQGGMYTDVEVHKIASLAPGTSPDFVQTGDPTGTGLGGAGFLFDLENSTLRHDFGVISMARASDPNSASSQFFISLGGAAAATLDGKYAAFGQLVGGADVLRAIAASPVGPDNRPLVPPKITSARLIDAPPLGDGPPPAKDPLGQKPER